MSDFKPHRIPLSEVRAGDIILCARGNDFLPRILSWLIQKIREPKWDRWGWHLVPAISATEGLSAEWPRVVRRRLDSFGEVRCYRIMENAPTDEQVKRLVSECEGAKYDVMIYFWTAIQCFWRGFPRIVNARYDCWECCWQAMDDFGAEFEPDYKDPWITDFLRFVGEL